MKPSRVILILLAAMSAVIPDLVFGQVITFQKEIRAAGYPYAQDVRQTPDGYVIAGYMQGFTGPKHLYLVKTDAYGDTLWTREFGDTTVGMAVENTFDGGFAVVGVKATYASLSESTYVVKTDVAGNLAWQRVFDGPSPSRGYSIRQTSDGGYVVTGVASGDVYLAKTDSAGNILWARTYGGGLLDVGYWVSETYDRGYIIAGYTKSFGAGLEDAYLIRTDPVGDTLWTRTFGGEGLDRAYSVQQTADSGFILGGFTYSMGEGYDGYLIRTNSNGDTLWTRHFGGVGHQHGKVVQRTLDDGYILAGPPTDISGDGNTTLVKTDHNGDSLWTKTFSNLYGGESVQQTTDGGYIVVGHNNYAQGIVLTKTDADGMVTAVDSPPFAELPRVPRLLQNYPNPFNPATIIEFRIQNSELTILKVFDLLGREVRTLVNEVKEPGTYTVQWDARLRSSNFGGQASGVSSGVYFYRLRAGDFVQTKRMLLLR